jgi:hypothetical protein
MSAVQLKPVPTIVEYTDNDMRAAAVAKFRELADKLESGELGGARVQWRPELHIEWVELDYINGEVRFRTMTEDPDGS